MTDAETLSAKEEVLLFSSEEPHVQAFREEVDQLRGLSEAEQLSRLNSVVNREVRYLTDYEHWNKIDKWGDPLATLVTGGDCEDVAILKREALKHLGWEPEQLAVLVGHTLLTRVPEVHSILMVTRSDGTQLLLDSLEDPLYSPLKDIYFRPMYALTATQMFMVKESPL